MTTKRKRAARVTRCALAISCAAAATLPVGVASAATDVWTNGGGTGVWTTAANWVDGTIPQPGDDVVFPMPGPASHTLTLPGPPTAGNATALSLTFDDSYTLNSGTLAMPGAPITVGPAAAVATINSRIASTTGLAKNGNGTVVLGGDNSNSLQGDFHINDGVLRVTREANFGAAFYKVWLHDTLEIDGTFTSERRFEPSNGTIRVTAGNTFTLSANDQFGFSSTDALYINGPGTVVRTGHTSRMGTTYFLGGTTKLQNGDFGYGPYVIGTDATLEMGPGMFAPQQWFVSNGTTLGVNSVLRGVGNVRANSVSGQAGVAMNATLAAATAGAAFEVNLRDNPGSAASVFHLAGPGTVKLLDLGLQYTGAWTIDGATLRLASAQSLGTGTSPIPVTGGGGVLMDGTGFGRTLELADGSFLRATGSLTTSGARLNLAPTANVTLGTLAFGDNLRIQGASSSRISGDANSRVTIDGPGKVTLVTANDAFAGRWRLDSGTLRVEHPDALGTAATAAVMINAGTTLELGGAFMLGRDVYFNDGAIRANGGSAALTGKITVGAGAVVTLGVAFGELTVGDEPNDITFGGATGDSFIHIGPNSAPVILTHPNDVKSTWVVKEASSLHVSDDAQLGPLVNTRPIVLDGVNAQLWTRAPITTARNIVVNAGTFNSNGFDSNYGNLTGAAPGGGTFAKAGDGTLSVNHVRIGGALSVEGGVLRIMPGAAAAGVSTLATVGVGATARLDLTDNALIVKDMPAGTFDGTAYDGASALLAAAYHFGAWDGADGIGTSAADDQGITGLGVAPADQVGYAGGTFRGTSVAAGDVIVMFTYTGDVNLDGLVDGADYGTLDNWIQFPGTSGYWNGDVNYDGVIDGADYGVLDNTIQLQGEPFITTVAGSAIGGVTAVPEPAFGTIAMAALAATFSRRRRRSSLGRFHPIR